MNFEVVKAGVNSGLLILASRITATTNEKEFLAVLLAAGVFMSRRIDFEINNQEIKIQKAFPVHEFDYYA